MTVGWLPAPAEELFGPDATAEESYEVLTVDVPPAAWIAALETARDTLGCTYFDWLSAVDEPGTGFRVSAHVVALSPVRRLLVRTTVPHTGPVLPSAVSVYAGAGWHERETHEMFGVDFEGHPGLDPLLLPEGFEGHPLRKDFVLAARVAKAWPGAKEPGESEHGGPKRRQMLPPGVPDPNEWGPLKGQLPPAPSRPARGAARAAGDRPVRRTRTAAEGSAGQTAPGSAAGTGPQAAATGAVAGEAPEGAAPAAAGAAPAGEGAASGTETARPARRTRSAGQGSASQRAAETVTPTEAGPTDAGEPASGPSSPSGDTPQAEPTSPEAHTAPAADAPWHQPKPAFEDAKPKQGPKTAGQPGAEPEPEPAPEPDAGPKPAPAPEPAAGPNPEPAPDAGPKPEPEPEPDPEPAPEVAPTRSPDDDPSGGPQ
ncbi:NADH-quinone oxidoreductase subunit C [Streptomyces sp. NBC_01281]|uniref:NADH-quinone oxidoreductase subunit C n=1 Tax=Streptomyces sp. NBC_01281 TaxID=2903811 RepID=UPI002E158AA2|nr:NADH-quinone oxidoreductase subunit C [Streptomyces sp. NBC_01281]